MYEHRERRKSQRPVGTQLRKNHKPRSGAACCWSVHIGFLERGETQDLDPDSRCRIQEPRSGVGIQPRVEPEGGTLGQRPNMDKS
jgi:hypothetical protein